MAIFSPIYPSNSLGFRKLCSGNQVKEEMEFDFFTKPSSMLSIPNTHSNWTKITSNKLLQIFFSISIVSV